MTWSHRDPTGREGPREVAAPSHAKGHPFPSIPIRVDEDVGSAKVRQKLGVVDDAGGDAVGVGASRAQIKPGNPVVGATCGYSVFSDKHGVT